MASKRAQDAYELEIKLDLTDENLRQLRSHPLLSELTVGHVTTRLLRSIYFDTEDDRLRTAGISLRVRRVSGKWVQTIKVGTDVFGGLSNPQESEVEVSGPEPDLSLIEDPALHQKISQAIGEATLVRVFETRIRRTTRHLAEPGGGKIELSLDKGEVLSETGVEQIAEAELELISGEADILLDIGQRLLADIPVALSQVSKAERGYRLARGKKSPLTPQKGEHLGLSSEDTIELAFEKTVGAAAKQILHNWRVVIDSDNPEGPHQLRIGLRRMRSALRAFRPVIDSSDLRRLGDNAREIARLVGKLRDADVIVMDICEPVAFPAGEQELKAVLVGDLRAHRGRIRDIVRTELKDPRWSIFQVELALLSRAVWWREDRARAKKRSKPARTQAQNALEKSWRKVNKWGKNIGSLDIEERHAMRKTLKTLRYTVEFFKPIYRRKTSDKFVTRLKDLQDIFGYLNDVALAEQVKSLRPETSNVEGGRAGVCALEYVTAWHKSRADDAWRDAQKRWKRLEKVRPFWK